MSRRTRLLTVLLFAATMALFEAAVVADLRRLWEIGEIDLGVSPASSRLLLAELLREAASLVMIVSVAILAGRRGIERFAFAALVFGIWDVLYYVFLWLLIGWPPSVFEWDALFLIPRPWIGPVLAPVLVSIGLIAGGAAVLSREQRTPLSPRPTEWIAGGLGGALVIASFVIVKVPTTRTGAPEGFSWPLFLLGLALALVGILVALLRPDRTR